MIDIMLDVVFSAVIREFEMITYELRDSFIDIKIGNRVLRIQLLNVPRSFTPEDNDTIAQSIVEFLTERRPNEGMIAGISNIVKHYGYDSNLELI